MKKTYRVMAVMTSYCYIEIEAESKKDAFDIAQDTDGGDFIEENPLDGDWSISMENIIEKKENKDEV